MGDVLSNVIGAPFSQYITEQLKMRASIGSTKNRTNEQILYLANKMSWTRLSSSVRIKPTDEQPLSKFYANLFNGQIPPGDYSLPDSLAKNWILQAGTSEFNNGTYNLRSGLGPNSAYGLGGIEQQGYRPMPGLTSVTIDTKGTLGSLREANINFSVWNMTQLNIIEALYFRLGYTMLLEWGHTNYFTNPSVVYPNGEFVTNPYGLDIFNYDSKEEILQAITQRNKNTDGNYDAMLGTVTNFYFSFNTQGGYDCNVKLIGLGSIIDTLRINQTFTMPATLYGLVEQAENLINSGSIKELELRDQERRKDNNIPAVLPPKATNLDGIKAIYNSATNKTADAALINDISYNATQYVSDATATTAVDYYYLANGTNVAYNNELNNDPNNTGADRTGLFLTANARRSSFQRIPANVQSNPQPVKLDFNAIDYLSTRQGFTEAAANLEKINYTQGTINATIYPKVIRDISGKVSYSPLTKGRSGGLWEPLSDISSTNIGQYLDSSLNVFNKGFNKDNRAYFSSTIKKDALVDTKFGFYIAYVSNNEQKFIEITIDPVGNHTRQEYIIALDNWFRNITTVNIIEIQAVSIFNQNQVLIDSTIEGLSIGKDTIKGKIQFNDSGLISQVLPRPSKTNSPIPKPAGTVDPQGNTVGQGNETNAAQTEQKEKFNSSLHTMLNAVKAVGFAKGLGVPGPVVPVDLTEITGVFFQSGVLQDVFSTLNDSTNKRPLATRTGGALGSAPLRDSTGFNLTNYAIKGFNSNMMADQTKYRLIKDINWTKFGQDDHICTAYFVRYYFNPNDTSTAPKAEMPVYIKLGYLLAFINNMCLLYESASKKDSSKDNSKNTIKPYTYIDFHPDYNFCLTAPQHMTMDPSKCFIPLVSTNLEYEDLYDTVDARKVLGENIFKPEVNSSLSALKAFKTNNAYQGKTMEILLNIQFILDLADRFITGNKHSSVTLKPFLDALMDEVSKITGNFNLFRVAYRDDSNTVIIKDDQWTPNLEQETSAIEKQSYLANREYMELQIFGSGSLVREMEFKTNMSTKMSSVIAISAQSGGNAYANGVDASPIAIYNTNYEDAIMPLKQDVNIESLKDAKSFINQLDEEVKQKLLTIDTNNQAAIKFNNYVQSIYYGGRVPISQNSTVLKYYQDRLNNLKARDITTTAAPFIPANLSITLDGISGIVMGNAFGIPENRLPASLRGDKGNFTKVGFAVVGLTHTLQNNQWLTKIRGQMINLRDRLPVKTATINSSANTNTFGTTNITSNQVVDLSTLNLNSDWVNIAFQYISKKESFVARPGYDYTRIRAGYGSDNFVDANGNVSNVVSSTVFTKQDAERTLLYNITGPYKNGVINQIGLANWDNLKPTQQAALVSYAYNAGPGRLRTQGIAAAIKTNQPAVNVAYLISLGPITATDSRTGVSKVLSDLVTRRAEEAKLYLN